ncbi:hypothetical protein [Actinopolyspora halophila]|uniref:hypothetical protein n=1 Tax=Actinopolyspora halophila TaxID=1850 RepID=UPI0006881E0F|nr:hypothetical protein [Actinopolyspora halophila]
MARIRTIKPDFFRSRTIEQLTLEQRLTFIGLWTHCDDEGRAEYDPRLLKADVWPLSDRTAADVADDVRALTESSLITHYRVADREYIQVNGWREHQKINRPTPSKLPPPENAHEPDVTSDDSDSLSTHGELSEDSPPEGNREQGTGNKEQGGATSSPAGRGKRAHPLPDDWTPTDKHHDYARRNELDLDREAFKFRNHAHSKARKLVDWNAGFSNWLAKSAEQRPKTTTPNTLRGERIAEQ